MGLPSGAGFLTSIIDAPSGDVSGYTALKDATDLLADSDYSGDINVWDGAYARHAWNATEEEIAFDWITDDLETNPGIIALGLDVVLAASTDSARTIRYYSPNTRNTAYASGDTYGAHAAYPSDLKNYYAEGGGVDRTGNNTLAGYGSISEGDSTGVLGKATSYNGTDQYFSADVASVTDTPITMIAWINPDSIYSYRQFLQLSDKDVGTEWFTLAQSTSNTVWFWPRCSTTSSGARTESSETISAGSWYQVTGIGASSTSHEARVNNSGSETTTTECTPADIDRTTIGRDGDSSPGSYFEGFLSHIKIYNTVKSDDFLSYDYSQLSDNSNFWSPPIWVSGGEGAVTGADTLTISDTASAEIGLFLTGSDALAMVDTADASIGLSITGSDSLAFSDSASSAVLLTLTANDGLVFSDTGSASITIAVSGLDSLGLGDSGSTGGIIPLSGLDSVIFADSASVNIVIDVSGSDNMGLGDLGTGGDIVIGTGVDNIAFSDAASVEIAVSVTGSDTISLSEVESIIHSLDLSGSDILGLSDAAQTSGVIAGILRLATTKLGESRTSITKLGESQTIVTKYKS